MSEKLFDLSDEYDVMLNKGLKLSGEDKTYFMAGRVQDLKLHLPPDFRPRRILDFGCGIGDTTHLLAENFPDAAVVGLDTSEKALIHAEAKYGSPRIHFSTPQKFSVREEFDLCYVNGVFHHINPQERPKVISMIYQLLVPGGYFALFENNPWNPGTRLIMSRIPFDRNAILLTPLDTRRLIQEGGFVLYTSTRSLFYFPRLLAALRFAEKKLAWLPFGAQYYLLAVKT